MGSITQGVWRGRAAPVSENRLPTPQQSAVMSKEVMMSMRMPPEGGASHADHHAPAATQPAASADNYSSNYKGVMLCDRPGIEVDRTAPRGGHAEPFLSAVNAPEQLGLNPIKKQHLHGGGDGKKAKPKNTALTNHKRWLKSLQMLKKELAEEEEVQQQEKRNKLAVESQKMRDNIRQIKKSMTGIDDIQGPASARALISKEEMLGELKNKFNRDVVEDLHDKVADKTEKAAPADVPPLPPKSAQPKPSSAKPAWARTEAEEEENEEMEVEDLLAFAEELDIDQYMDDCEFREALAAAKARISELESDDECEDDEVATQCTERTVGSVYSTMSAALRANEEKEKNGDKDWDGSVKPDTERSRTSRLSRAVAEELLEMNPNLRRKHSARSLAEVVEKKGIVKTDQNQGDTQAFDPQDHEKFGRCGMGAVKVAVHTEENRLHRHGEVKEGKDLPYLYRNPAV